MTAEDNKISAVSSGIGGEGYLRVKPTQIAWIIVLLPFLFPPNAWLYIGGYRVLHYSQMVAIVGITAAIAYHFRDFKGAWLPFFCFGVFNFTYVISTFVNRGNLLSAMLHFVVLTLLCALVIVCINDRKMAVDVLVSIRSITIFFFAVNLLLEVFFPSGISRFVTESGASYWLYGNVNAVIRKILPGIVSSMILDKMIGRLSKSTVFLWIGIFFQLTVVYFSASTCITMLFVLFWCVFEKKVAKHYKSIYLIVLFIVAFFEVTIVINSAGGAFQEKLTRVLGKSSNFTGRAYLWTRAVRRTAQRPLFGYGYLDDETIGMYIGNNSGAHNYYLDIAFQRGMIGVVALLVIILLPFIRIRRKNMPKTSYRKSVFHILFGFSCAIYIMFLIEPFFSSEYLILPIVFSSLAFLNKRNRNLNDYELMGGKSLYDH